MNELEKKNFNTATNLLISAENLIESCCEQGIKYASNAETHDYADRMVRELKSHIPHIRMIEIPYLEDMVKESVDKIVEAKLGCHSTK